MKKNNLRFLFGLPALLLALSFGLMGCPNDSSDPDPDNGDDNGNGNGTTTSLTYTVTADGNKDAITTKITFAFSGAVNGLTAGDITLGDGATKGALTGTGTSYELAVSAITKTGPVTVKIANKSGVDSAQHSVNVFHEQHDFDPNCRDKWNPYRYRRPD